MKPFIALNCSIDTKGTGKVSVNRTYVEAVLEAGGIPLPVSPMPNRELRQVLKMVRGFVFIGGHDYAPSLYGQRKHASVELVHPIRQEFDLRLMKAALASYDEDGRPKPILSICGGHQLLNIVLGGSLTQDIESARPGYGILHRNRDEGGPARHDVKVIAGTQLARLFPAGVVKRPISSHHQAIDRLGKGLTVSGFSEDGMIEAIEHLTRQFTLGVQWHPEADYKGSAPLFKELIKRSRSIVLS